MEEYTDSELTGIFKQTGREGDRLSDRIIEKGWTVGRGGKQGGMEVKKLNTSPPQNEF